MVYLPLIKYKRFGLLTTLVSDLNTKEMRLTATTSRSSRLKPFLYHHHNNNYDKFNKNNYIDCGILNSINIREKVEICERKDDRKIRQM